MSDVLDTGRDQRTRDAPERSCGSCGGPVSTEVVEGYADEVVVSLILCRVDELRRAGCDDESCYSLAGRLDVDLDRALELIARGCAPDLALRILV